MRAIVVANCQARPISQLLQEMHPAIEMAEPIILHLARPADAARDREILGSVDAIFAQLTSETFTPEHLSTKALRAAFSDSVIVWPNIFYAGQQPYLRYFTHATAGRMVGPLEAMHDLRFYRSWLRTGQVDAEAVLRADPQLVTRTHDESLAALRAKDSLSDVSVADLITSDPKGEQLFFTFNHPRRILLTQVAAKLLNRVGLKVEKVPPERVEPLGRYRVPGIDTAEGLQGDSTTAESGRRVHRYGLSELAEAFNRLYGADDRFRDVDNIRLTPNIGWELDYLAKC